MVHAVPCTFDEKALLSRTFVFPQIGYEVTYFAGCSHYSDSRTSLKRPVHGGGNVHSQGEVAIENRVEDVNYLRV